MKRKNLWITVLIFGIPVLIGIMFWFRSLMSLFLVSLILCYLLCPVVRELREKGVPAIVAVLICYAILLCLLLFLLIVILPDVFAQFQGILDALPVYYEYILSVWDHYPEISGLMPILSEFGIEDRILSFLDAKTDMLADMMINTVALIPRFLLYSFLVPVVSYYLLRDKDKIAVNILLIFPPGLRVAVTTVWEEINNVLKGFIGGSLLVSLFVGILTFLGLFALGADYAAALAILYGLLDIIPYFGPILGALPVILLTALQGDINVFWVILLIFFVQQTENYFISPRVLGDHVGVHPVSVIFLVLAGGTLGGIWGMILSVPLAAVIKVIVKFLYKRFVATAID